MYFSGDIESWAIPKGYHRKSPGKGNSVLKAVASHKNLLLPLDIAAMQKTGKTTPGEAYNVRYTDDFGNDMLRLVERPDVISKLFNDSNTIVSHNQSRQHDLVMEKLLMTLIGINVYDTWKIADYHGIIYWTKN